MQNIDVYYESLKQVYEQIVNWPKRKPPLRERIVDWLIGIVGAAFAVSLIPVLPTILVFVGSQAGFVIGPINLSGATLGTLVIIWIVLATGTGTLFGLMLWINDKVDSLPKESWGPPQTLSPEQLTFIAIYEAYKELKIFFVSRIEQHVNNSLKALARIRTPVWILEIENLRYRFREGEAFGENADTGGEVEALSLAEMSLSLPQVKRLTASFPRQVLIAQSFLQTFEKYAWFQLDAETKSILQALISFPEKIPYGLKQKDDLPTVLSILENLSNFTYAYLPEHKTYMDSEALGKLQAEGAECLSRFVKEVNALTYYPPPTERKISKTAIAPPSLREKFRKSYQNNVFVRFTLWFVLTLLLTSVAVSIINQFAPLSSDTMATIAIGTSVASAAALAGFLPRTSKPESNE